MKPIGKMVFCSLIALLAAFPAPAQDKGLVQIAYMGFSDMLELSGGRLNHSFAQNSSAPRSGLLQLTPRQERLFVEWLEQCQVFSLVGPDVMVSEPNHPGAMERSSLQVEYKGKKIKLSWGGVSTWNDPDRQQSLDRAIEELTKLSFRLLREAGLLD